MRRRVRRRAKKRIAVITGKASKSLLLGREGSCGWEYLSEEGEGEVEERDFSFAPWASAARPGAAVLPLSDLRSTLSSTTMNLITHVPLSLFNLRFATLVRAMSGNSLLKRLPPIESGNTALSTMFVPLPGLCLVRARARS